MKILIEEEFFNWRMKVNVNIGVQRMFFPLKSRLSLSSK